MASPRNFYRAWMLAASLAALSGLAAIVVGFATGNVPLLVVAYAVVFGAGFVPSLLDWHHAQSLVRLARQPQAVEIIAVPDIEPETVAVGLVWFEPEGHRLH